MGAAVTTDRKSDPYGEAKASPIPRVVVVLRAGGGMDVLADRPCRVFVTGGGLGQGHAELPPPRVGWAVVTAALADGQVPDEAISFEQVARLYEGRPCDTEA